MDTMQLLTLVGGVFLSVLGYFLRQTMNDLRSTKMMSYTTKNELDLLKNDFLNKYTNMSDKFDELKAAMIELTKELKELNKRVK